MANTVIALKKSGTLSAVPSSLEFGELAVNYADGKIYYKNSASQIVEYAPPATGSTDSFKTINASGTLVVASSPTDILTLIAGTNITIQGDAVNDSITISSTGGSGASVNVSENGPVSPAVGDLWWNSNTGKLLIYYTDVDATSQWVETSSAGGGTETGQIASAFNQANAAYNQANSAFDRANVAIANVNYVNTATQAAFAEANSAEVIAVAAYNQTNVAIANVNYVNTAAQAAFNTSNIAIANVNYVNTATQAAFAEANNAEVIAVAAYNAANNAGGITVGKAIAIALVFGG